jgi:outer membrane biosynthesis protein TonB
MIAACGNISIRLTKFTSVEAAALARQQKGFIQMINTLKRAPALPASILAILFAVAAPAFAQAPSDAQRAAIRAQCRSDYMAHCSSVPPGGMASLQCLQKNMSSLSSGCQTAVRAVEAPAESKAEPKSEPKTESKTEPKGETAPAAEPARPAAETAAPPAPKTAASPKPAATASKKPSSAQIAAIRSSCRSDYQRACAGVPTGGAAALNCLEKNKAELSPSCRKAVSAASGGGASPAAGGGTSPAEDDAPAAAAGGGPGAAPADAPAPVLVLRPMRPREVLFVLRSACGGDVRALCGDVPPGGGRIIQCLASQSASLSPACMDVMSQFAAQ